jgi:hypothetical protein
MNVDFRSSVLRRNSCPNSRARCILPGRLSLPQKKELMNPYSSLRRGGESVELISAGDAPLRSTAGGGKHCAAERPVLGARFILRGGARRGIVEL